MSCSCKNFAVHLVREHFSEEEMKRSNVNGRKKDKLNEEKITSIRNLTFCAYPLSASENEKSSWNECIVAIDKACRRLNRMKKQ